MSQFIKIQSQILCRYAGAIVAAAAFSGAAAAQTATSSGHALLEPKVESRPWTVADIDCASFSIDTRRAMELAMRPAKTTPELMLHEAFPDGFPLAKLKKSLEVDPGGLCRYRDENQRLPPPTRHRVIFLGDSITEIWGSAAFDLFGGEVLDRGISGQNTSQMLLRFRADVLSLKPAVVHIMGGINDINTPAGTALTRANIESMVDLAQLHGIRVVLASITPCASFYPSPGLKPAPQIVLLNAWLKDFAQRRGIVFIDYYSPLVDANGGLRANLTNDALHPNALGFAVMTPLAKAAIAAALQCPAGPLRGACRGKP